MGIGGYPGYPGYPAFSKNPPFAHKGPVRTFHDLQNFACCGMPMPAASQANQNRWLLETCDEKDDLACYVQSSELAYP